MADVEGPAASTAAGSALAPCRCSRLITSCVSSLVRPLRCFRTSSRFALTAGYDEG